MAALSVRNLSKSYGGVRALAGVSFDVSAGEIVALIGPNGAGKTTCFNALNGQLAPDSGEVLLDGTSLVGRAPHATARMGVGRTFQVAATFGSMSVRENVQTALHANHRRPGEADAILTGVAEMINNVFRVTWGHVIDPAWSVNRVWCALLGVEPPEGPGAAASAWALAVTVLLLVLVIERKLRPVEVVS